MSDSSLESAATKHAKCSEDTLRGHRARKYCHHCDQSVYLKTYKYRRRLYFDKVCVC